MRRNKLQLTRTALSVFAVGALAVSATGHAAGSPAAGERKSQPCQACHGADGRATAPTYPHLAGQHEDYLVRALKDYKSGARENEVMSGFAKNLSEQDIRDLAAFYASRPPLLETADME